MRKTLPYSYRDPNRFRAPFPINSLHLNIVGYKRQADEVLAASAALTDEQKMTAELFDNKLRSLGFSILFASQANGLTLDEFVQLDFLTNMAAFDTAIAIWNEKVRYDAVRPFSAIRHLYRNQQVTAWGGPGKGTVNDIPASEWRSYLNTADHPEYPSGSASFCGAHAQASRRFLGSDNLGWNVPIAKGSSIVEPGVTPATDGLSGIPGLLLGGVIGDAIRKRRDNGRMLVGAIALLLSVPLIFFALGRPGGSLAQFIVLMGAGCALMNVYYSTVYSAIQDVIEPSLRGTAMALYFCAMYLLGASLGPVGTGFLSDYFTAQAAGVAGVTELTRETLEPFRASGLRSAMYVIPALGAALTLVLLAGSRTVTNDMRKLQSWMRDASLSSNIIGSIGSIEAEAGRAESLSADGLVEFRRDV
jgi:multisubunit Na+/H+ antiporter MnhB subunit